MPVLSKFILPVALLFSSAFSSHAASPTDGLASAKEATIKSIKVNFNQDFVNQAHMPGLDLTDRDAVLRHVLVAMREEITVYPSEGYYYFDFFNEGENIRGNLRFDASFRDEGRVSFVYFKAHGNGSNPDFFHMLSKDNGVSFKKLSPFIYELRFESLVKKIYIYDAKRELADKPELPENEEYIGPSFDESGVRFDVIFDHDSKVFLYQHNTRLGASETFRSVDLDRHLIVGNRTGFAYYNDTENKRRILVGVLGANVASNSYFDGPFDQLPDSFLDPMHLKSLIEKSNPNTIGKIGAYGTFINDEDSRYAISPYIEYAQDGDLYAFLQCRDKKGRSDLNKCLSSGKTW